MTAPRDRHTLRTSEGHRSPLAPAGGGCSIGINSGEVVVGDMGSSRIMAYTAIGSHVNLGARMESKAPIDGVLGGAPVDHSVTDTVSARFAGRIMAKGISGNFETCEIVVS